MATPEELIPLLDPDRDYGERTFEQVKQDIQRGVLLIEPGHTLPVLRLSSTNQSVKGTGRPPGYGDTKVSRVYIEEQFGDNKEAIWNALFKGAVTDGDPRWGKLLLEYGLGKPMENASTMNEATMALLKMLSQNAGGTREVVREVVFEQGA